jgi:hypothetical protein
MEFFWELYQHRGIQEAQSRASEASSRANDARLKLDDVELRAEKALLVCAAIWSLLEEKLGVTEDDLLNRIKEIDASDGQLDGKLRRPPAQCPKCSRTTATRLRRCMYCGADLVGDAFA